MEKRLSKGECNVWYAKYLHSKQSFIFPSGIEVSFSGATINSLILAVVLYEEYDTWAGK